MPAQKLTRARLIQILLMLTLLLIAFFWRTATHHIQPMISCQKYSECVIHLEQQRLEMMWQTDDQLLITGLPRNWKVINSATNRVLQVGDLAKPLRMTEHSDLTLLTANETRYTLHFTP